jgi:hypothetical protein
MGKLSKIEVGNAVGSILTAVAAGSSLVEACAAQGLKVHQFQFRVLNNATLHRQWLNAKRSGQERRAAAGALRYAEQILVKIESGMSVRQACASDERFPSRGRFVAALRHSPNMERRYSDALDRQADMHRKCVEAFPEIEHRIKAGASILDALQPREAFPDYSTFTRFLKANPEYDARYRAAGRVRQSSPNARRNGPQYSPAELRQAATALMLSDARTEIHTSRLAPGGIHAQTLLRARFRDPDLLVAVESAVVARRTRLQMTVGGRPKIDPANVRLIAPPKILESDPTARLASALSQNDIWRLAAAALPKHLDRNVRDDIIGEIAVAVLAGDLAPHMIQPAAKRFVRDHNKNFSPYQFASLDKSLSFDSTLNVIDTLTSDAWE